MKERITVRSAEPGDQATLVAFNRAMAQETEDKPLDLELLASGIGRLLEHPEHGRYYVAQSDGTVVGALMITTEWSDWRNGLFWWIQSVYVLPEHRRHGVYRALHSEVRELARAEPDVCGLRLYVERENQIAQHTYRRLGMDETVYRIYEETFS